MREGIFHHITVDDCRQFRSHHYNGEMASVSNHYQSVIDSVINASKESFVDEGVDEHILYNLKNLWERKLAATKAVDYENKAEGIPDTKRKPKEERTPRKKHKRDETPQPPENKAVIDEIVNLGQQQVEGNAEGCCSIMTTQIKIVMVKDGVEEAHIFVIKVPANAMEDDRLHNLLTSSVITAVTSLPQELGNAILQQHVNAAFFAPKKEEVEEEQEINIESILKDTMGVEFGQNLDQIDGCNFDSSDDDDCDVLEKPTKRGGGGGENKETDNEGPDEPSLNSEDDITDEEHNGLFDSENIVVCQYEKVTRVRNKWKLNLKSGIMYLDGKDFLFNKAVGDTEW